MQPWETERDCGAWFDEQTELRCLIERHPTAGHLCGYVGVPAWHPLYFVDWEDPRVQALDVHGGVTFAGTAGGMWVVGFDCGHLGDLAPYAQHFQWPGAVYRDWSYVAEQCRLLAKQLAAMA